MIHVNRVLNLKRIKAIGFDMDYTLVRYDTKAFEELSYNKIKEKLIQFKGYPQKINELQFDFNRAIRGLVIDKPLGNVLKLSTYSKVKQCYHGLKELPYKILQETYKGQVIDLNMTERYSIVDTAFSIAYCVLYMQIVEIKDNYPDLSIPAYETIENDLLQALDEAHRDDSLKSVIKKDVKKYIIPDENTVRMLERYVKHQKELWVITNSDYNYTQTLLDYTITPYLKDHKDWRELFKIVIVSAKKPRFFNEKVSFEVIEDRTHKEDSLPRGIFAYGSSDILLEKSNLLGDEILYLGDHIFGDVLTIKKNCNWRTALVIEELHHELESLNSSQELSSEIESLMKEKVQIENKIDDIISKEIEEDIPVVKEELNSQFREIEKFDKQIAKKLKEFSKSFNPFWGETMRAGAEPSRLAGQVEKYACVYMSKISDLYGESPRKYFRPNKRALPHEINSALLSEEMI